MHFNSLDIPLLSWLIDLNPLVPKFLITGITAYEYKINLREQKLSVAIYRKNRYWGDRFDTIR